MDRLSLSDLAWKLIPLYQQKIDMRIPKDLLKRDRLVVASETPQRVFAIIERLFFEHFVDTDFVELSPLQPIGINKVLGNVSGKKVIPTIRGQEVNADATTSLFFEAYKKGVPETRLATHCRTIRTKIFDSKTKFLPHFKVFAEVTIGDNSGKSPFGVAELMALASHLRDEVAVLSLIKDRLPNVIDHFDIYISNVCLARELVDAWTKKNNTSTPHIVELGAELLRHKGMPDAVPFDRNLINTLRSFGFKSGLRILEMFLEMLEVLNVGDVRLVFDPLRSAGADYYKHVVYKITATSVNGLTLPLADGGTTDWMTKMSGDKQAFVAVSGIGTELLAQNFLTLTC